MQREELSYRLDMPLMVDGNVVRATFKCDLSESLFSSSLLCQSLPKQ